MIIGFTGTRQGLTLKQANKLRRLLLMDYKDAVEAHHGDCIGADVAFHYAAKDVGLKIVIHPPLNNKYRARCVADELLPAREYLDRNKDIVNVSDILIAGPATNEEVLRSGTWSTIRYARRMNKEVIILEV